MSDPSALHPRLTVSPSKAHKLLFTKMRDKDASTRDFVNAAKRVMLIVAEDALAEFPTVPEEIQTPCGPFRGAKSIEENSICAVSIMRSGCALLESVREIAPSIKVGKILIQRDETQKEKPAKLIYHKLPPNIGKLHILLCDPMLATGGSAMQAIETLKEFDVKPEKIIFANVICCPEGLAAMAEKYPSVRIVTACIDSHLNEDKYIVPGLGDYGDRFFDSA